MAGNKQVAPSAEEAEVSIFGPGIGECIVLHLGNFEWLIVDSCVDPKSRNPIAIQYLKEIGIDVTTAVKCFVITHWHDDHIRGAEKILRECPSAKFVCSVALRFREFLELVNLHKTYSSLSASGLEEFAYIFEELKRRAPGVRPESIGPTNWASADRLLMRFPENDGSSRAEIYSLSPSDSAITLAFHEISQLIPQIKTTKRRAVAQKPNHVSVALWVMVGNSNILLGSDLEYHHDEHLGWKAILLSQTRPSGRAKIVKVPHHGSENAYCQEIWSHLLTPNPIALISPFSSSVKPLPSLRDIERIRAHTPLIFCTGNPCGTRPPRLDSVVEKTIRPIFLTRRAITGPMGHVRVRYPLKAEEISPTIETFEGAKQL